MTIADKIYEKLRKADPAIAQEVLDFLEFLESKKQAQSPSDSVVQGWGETFGMLKDSKAFQDDPVAIQRKLRDEWN